jgi:hypothetical protein
MTKHTLEPGAQNPVRGTAALEQASHVLRTALGTS